MNTTFDGTGYTRPVCRVHPDGEKASERARLRMETAWGEPLFLADWAEPVFLHFSVDPVILQPHVPFPLDTRDGLAYVSLVAFTMRDMRFKWGGELTRWLTGPIATHSFLNLRTYVKVGKEPGIHFMREWLNSRLATRLGPVTFGLPYRYGEINYRHDYENLSFEGQVSDGERSLRFEAGATERIEEWTSCEPCSLDEFLLERYTAFNARSEWRGYFRVWHEPWPQTRLKDLDIVDFSLIEGIPIGRDLQFVGGNVSTGAKDVWMGRPHRIGSN